MNTIFICGMFRSGTTLLARMVNAHPAICGSSDPMRPLFNSFRYDLADEAYRTQSARLNPMDDYFLAHNQLLEKVLESDLNVPLPTDTSENDALFETIVKMAMPYSGAWAESLPREALTGTYLDSVKNLLDHVCKTYAKQSAQAVAFKEVWITEMIPAVLRSFPGSRAVVSVRDPRAVAASNYKSGAKYPLTFLGRQWRKLAWLAHRVKQMYPDRVKLIHYEHFVEQHETEIPKLCDFCGVDFDERLLDLRHYTDGDGKPWMANTFYESDDRLTINTGSVDRWKSVLNEHEVRHLELIGYDLMRHYGYELLNEPHNLLGVRAGELPRLSEDSMADWLKVHTFEHDDGAFNQAVLEDKLRLSYILDAKPSEPNEKLMLQTI